MKKLLSVFFAIAAFAIFSTPKAEAATRFAIGWTPGLSMPSGATGAFSVLGGGIRLGFGGDKAAFEIGAGYAARSLNSATYGAIDAPIGLRLYLGNVFRMFIGGFFDYYLTPFAAGKTIDYGLRGGLGFGFGSKTKFVMDFYYDMGLGNLAAAGTVNYRGLTGFLGVQFGGK